MLRRIAQKAPLFCAVLVVLAAGLSDFSQAQPSAVDTTNAFVNFETAPVHPLALSPDRTRLVACNVADGKLEVCDVTSGNVVPLGSVPVGIDPVSVRFRNSTEAWVLNYISASISVVDVPTLRVVATIDTLDSPADVAFAGSPARAFVSCPRPNVVQVFNPDTRQGVTNLSINAERPKALAVSPDGQTVYVAIFESGNQTTIIGGKFRNFLFFGNAVSLTNGPYGGQNPPPNAGTSFNPPLNPTWSTNVLTPPTGLIVRKNDAGRWMDDNLHDWTEFVSGTNAAASQRVPGWDLPDRDLAILDATDFSVTYATGLMNICMAVEVNPASGRVAVVGTDAINERRFEPNLNGIFSRVKFALVDPLGLSKTVQDLNPHLDYANAVAPESERAKSIGDPRALVWTADGSRGYLAGMGSRNVVAVDGQGNRLSSAPIEVGEGPCGLALDEARQRLYVFNRFSSSISVVDTVSGTVINAVPFFDPTPVSVAAGRRQLYDTRRTSGLGQAACASCHVDARMDRLAWDLGSPAGQVVSTLVNAQNTLVTNQYHPMKGVMVTQTLQDIIGHEPFHWRGDRADIEAFSATFTNLQGAPAAPSGLEMKELRDLLASIHFAPNRYRNFDNSLSTNLFLPGHYALGDDLLPAGAPLPAGNAASGLQFFQTPPNFCISCHTAPTGLGRDAVLQAGAFKAIPTGPDGEHHFPLAFRLEGGLRSKITQFRNLADKIGMDLTRSESRAGFGFGHDGSVDSLTRFLTGVRVVRDQDVANLIAFLVSAAGGDPSTEGGPPDSSPPAAVGRQLTVSSPLRSALFDAMLVLARSPTGRVDLIAKGFKDGLARGWVYDASRDVFQSDRMQETSTADALLALAGPGAELTFTVVPRGLGIRLGIDRDLDGVFDRDELDAGTDPATLQLRPRILPTSPTAAVGTDLLLTVELPPMPAPISSVLWQKDGQTLAGQSNFTLALGNLSFEMAGDYAAIVNTPFQSWTSAPVRLTVVPLLVTVSPGPQAIRLGSNAVFTATVVSSSPVRYQWLFNGHDLPGPEGASLVVSNIVLANEGDYRVRASNDVGDVLSDPVNLAVLVNPAVVIPPLSQSVVVGGNATFSAVISGHPPPFGFLLRKGSEIITNYTSPETMAFFTLSNVQTNDAGTYRLVVTNAANPTPGLAMDPVSLTVLADTDHDGLPDEWEAAHDLGTNNAADAQLDSDRDGQSNLQEYLAGTDPWNADSLLRLEPLLPDSTQGIAVLRFNAVSNKTYTVQSAATPSASMWNKILDFPALPTNRLVTITNDLSGAPARFYRIVTPRVP